MTAVTFHSDNPLGDCPAILEGDFSKTTKGLIVLHEWWGMNEQIKKEAKDIGEMGNFITVVPDLYRGKVAVEWEEADHLATNLDWTGALADVKGAAEFLLRKGCTKVGAMGFCNGGALSLMAAALLPSELIAAIAPFYGIPRPHRCDLTNVNIPVQAHFGAKDHLKGFSSLEDALGLKEKLSGKKDFEIYIYEDCGHAFTNPTAPGYNKEITELSLGRVVEFMKKHLSDEQTPKL